MNPRVRPAAVAGAFYPADAAELRSTVDALLAVADAALAHAPAAPPPPKAVIAPHAGYPYSGPIAASVYARLRPLTGTVTRVVLLGPAHRVPVEGMVLPDADALRTPLGTVPVDASDPALADVPRSEIAHRLEHSLEVQLPFLQRVLRGFSVIPLVVGRAAPEQVGRLIEALWGGPETLIVVSSDLSHYLPYGAARRVDAETARHISGLRFEAVEPEDACGAAPLAGLLWTARRKGLAAELVDLRNSGDTQPSMRDRVVGYGGFVFREADPTGGRGGELLH